MAASKKPQNLTTRRKLRSAKPVLRPSAEYADLKRELDLSEDSSEEESAAPSSLGRQRKQSKPKLRNTLAKIYRDSQKRISEEERLVLEKEIKRNLHEPGLDDSWGDQLSFDMIDDQSNLSTTEILNFVRQTGSDLEWLPRYSFIHWKPVNRARELSYQSYFPKKSSSDIENMLKRLASSSTSTGSPISQELEEFICGGWFQQCFLVEELPNSMLSWLFHIGMCSSSVSFEFQLSKLGPILTE
jgi:hypothetical protein